MNISDQIKDFAVGKTISREDFTPEVQDMFVNRHFGLADDRGPQVIQEGQLAVSQDEYNAMKSQLDNYSTVFNAPGVKEQIGNIIMGEAGPAVPSGTAHHYPASPAQPVVQQPAQPVVTQTPPAPVAPDGTAAPAIPGDSTGDHGNEDWWAQITGNTVSAPNDSPVSQNANPGQTLDNYMTTPAPAPSPTPSPAPSQPSIEAVVSEYRNQIGSAALAQGINPQEVYNFLDNLSPQDAVAMFAAANQPASQPSPINLAEERGATGPISVHQGIGDILGSQPRFRV